MNNIPKRRQGIDGLSHRSSSELEPAYKHSAHTPKTSLTPRTQDALQSTEHKGFALHAGVSHPSLPQQHSRIQDKTDSSIRKLLRYPFEHSRDRHVAQLGVIATVLDVRFWLLICSPLLIIRLTQLTKQSPAELSQAINELLTRQNYVWGVVIICGIFMALTISVLVVRIARQVLMATTIRRIDHRVGRTHILIRHAVCNIARTTLSWMVDVLLVSLVAVFSGLALYWLTVFSPDWLVPWRSYAAGAVGAATLVALAIITMRRHLQQAMLSTTILPVHSIQLRSYRLVVRNFGISTAALCAAFLELLLATLAVLAVSVWLHGILPNLTTIPGRLSAWLLGAIVMALLWLATVVWQSAHWAGLYHTVVLRSKKDEVSDYLVPPELLKFRLRPILAVSGLALLALSLIVFCSVVFHSAIWDVGKAVKKAVPSDVSRLVPGIDSN